MLGRRKQKSVFAMAAMVMMMGFIEYSNVARNPRFETYRTVDVLGLTGCGMCFGVGLTLVMMGLRARKESKQV